MVLANLASATNITTTTDWELYPSTDRGKVATYKPTFNKHFKVKDGVLIGTTGLGAEFYEDHKLRTFEGIGNVWATNVSWPSDLQDFELTFDYKWFQEEPMKKFGDFPDMRVGVRLNKEGKGYVIGWGFLGQIRPTRMGGGVMGLGKHRGLKGKWAKVRILVAGPIMKVKVWPDELRGKKVEEPIRWNVETYDNWEGSNEPNYRMGAIALGFSGRKVFDTCVYEFRNVNLKTLKPEEAKAVQFFDPDTAPKSYAKGPSTKDIKVSDSLPIISKDVFSKSKMDKNIKVLMDNEGVTMQSLDGKPAFVWKFNKAKTYIFRAKSNGGARPIIGVKVTDKKAPIQISYMDPIWKLGIAAVLHENENHTANSARFVWKDDTEYDFIVSSSHWQKWQIVEVDNPENRVNFSARTYEFNRQTSKRLMGIGVAGKEGSVVVTRLATP